MKWLVIFLYYMLDYWISNITCTYFFQNKKPDLMFYHSCLNECMFYSIVYWRNYVIKWRPSSTTWILRFFLSLLNINKSCDLVDCSQVCCLLRSFFSNNFRYTAVMQGNDNSYNIKLTHQFTYPFDIWWNVGEIPLTHQLTHYTMAYQ